MSKAAETDLTRVPFQRLLAELETRAQTPGEWSMDQVLHIIVIAVVLAVLADVGTRYERGTLH